MTKYIVHFDPHTLLTIWTPSQDALLGYYYHCPQALGDFGPFENQLSALRHYNSLIKTVSAGMPTLLLPKPGKVIYVDFANKRRY